MRSANASSSPPRTLPAQPRVSKATRAQFPGDIDTKMLPLHAPEELGLSKNYIEEGAGH